MAYTVIFQPSGRRGEVEDGKTLLDAARELGVEIESICNGKQTCGKCKVRIEEGRFERYGIESRQASLSPMTREEARHLTPGEIEGQVRLACQAAIRGDVLVFVPEPSRRAKQIVRKEAGEVAVTVNPAIRKYFVELTPPTLHDSTGDVDRLLAALAETHGLHDLKVDYQTLRTTSAALRTGDWKATAAVWTDRELVGIEPGCVETAYGMAVDIGTTTVAGYLTELTTGKVVATESAMNPQVAYGEDVISRMTYAGHEEGLRKLHTAIVEELNEMIRRATGRAGLRVEDVQDIVVVGNTAMHHLFLNIDPRHVGRSPFPAVVQRSVDVKARDLGLRANPGAYVHVLPNEAGFVGADNVGVLIAQEPYDHDEVALIIDIGTNGEIVVGNRQRLLSTSCATGPALEGAHIQFGVRAAPGAIERVAIDEKTLDVRFKVIGKPEWHTAYPAEKVGAVGICGSGIIDAAAEMFRCGIVLKSGRFNGELVSPRLTRNAEGQPQFVIAWARETALGTDITVSIKDIRAVQLAKGALYCGAKILLRRYGVTSPDKVILAGAFGSYIDKGKAMLMGLFPDCDPEKVYSVGNAAGDGARIALLDVAKRAEAEQVAGDVEYVELATEPTFQTDFMEAMYFPHMKDSFPHVTSDG